MPAALLTALVFLAQSDGWRVAAPGVERRTVALADAKPVELLRFDLEHFRVNVLVPGAAAPRRAASLRLEAGAAAVVNGGFFDTSGRSLGLRISSGRVVIGLRPRVDWGVLVVRDRRAELIHSRDYRPDPTVTAALQVGPRLVVGGAPLRLKPQRARRTAVALDAKGRFLTLVVTEARVEATALAALLAELGFSAALMLDGGPSTQLSAVLGDENLELPGGYAVPDALLLLPR